MSLHEKYLPKTQKQLFHKNVVSHIRKWISNLEVYYKYNKNMKHILFLSGPIGSGKTTMINCLFKGFNIIKMSEEDDEKNIEIIHYNSDLLNISSRHVKKKNIIVIDNVENIDKSFIHFINEIHNSRNIPIVIISSSRKSYDLIKNYANTTIIEINAPTLLEMKKLAYEILYNEKLYNDHNEINNISNLIVEKSHFDIRQMIFIIEQYSKNISKNIKDFMNEIEDKYRDKDMIDRIHDIFNKQFKMKNVYQDCFAEPYMISNNIYYNLYEKSHLPIADYSKTLETLSLGDTIHRDIYENQNWDLHGYYTFVSCVTPTFYISRKLNNTTSYTPFKDISYNFITSYKEIKTISMISGCKYNRNNFSNILYNFDDCYALCDLIIECFKNINIYFNTNKKGKNTTKKEKFLLIGKIDDTIYNMFFEKLVYIIYNLNLYEYDKEFVENNRKKLDDAFLYNNFHKIDLRIFKRFINIFTFDESNKIFKTNIEYSVQYTILKMICENENKKIIVKTKNDIKSVDLSDIWNI